MKALVVEFAGAIGSGKTTLSRAVSQAQGWPFVSFGDYVREVARTQGYDESRKALQEVGASLIEDGWHRFCQAVLAQARWSPGESLVIDGVRHVEVLHSLRTLVAPSDLRLVFIDIDEPTREARLRAEGLIDREQLSRIESHSTETQVRISLPTLADLTVLGSRPEREILDIVLSWIRESQVDE
jgi:dephospho-CoA kinase